MFVTDATTHKLHMLILNADDVRDSLPMTDAIAGMKRAFAALVEGRANVPIRTQLPVAMKIARVH